MEPIDQGGCLEQFMRLFWGMALLILTAISLLGG